MPNGNDYELRPEVYLKREDEIDPSQSLVDGHYHFLIGEGYDYDGGLRGVIRYVQGARVKTDNLELKNLVWDDPNTPFLDRKIITARFYVNQNDYKLSDIFETTPWGVIKKNRTGIGATTLELTAKRDSIIVVPTRALAVSKVISTGFIEGTQKFKCHYVGSNYEGFANTHSSIEVYLDDSQIEHKKFLVVSDSLGRLLEHIKSHGRGSNDFFLLVDEIDSYQYDNTYRPDMEKVIDHYFTFPWYNRCMLSATVSEFSNPKINEEPFFDLVFMDPPKRKIDLIHAPSICSELAAYIEYLFSNAPDQKILIAYNSIEKILATINLLKSPIREECAIYCSERSKYKIPEYYAEFKEDKLRRRINFITCTYFVGIDILDQYHLISVSDVSQLYSVLSTDKFTQIAGRCRHENGLLSETLIYNTFIKSYEYNRDELLPKIQTLTNKILAGYDPVIGEFFKDLGYDIKSLVEKSKFYYQSDTSYPLLRIGINGNLDISYLNIDAFLIMMGIKHELYISPDNLGATLSSQHNVWLIPPTYTEFQYKETMAIAEAKLKIKNNEKVVIDTIIDELSTFQTIDQRREYIIDLLWNYSPYEDYLNLFLEFQEYVAFEDLLRVLPRNVTPGNIKQFKNSARFWALDDDHVLKKEIREKLPIGRIPANQCRASIADILRSLFSYEVTSPKDATQKLDLFCQTGKRKRNRNSDVGTDFEIVSFDPLDFCSAPLTRIPANTPLNEIIEF